MKLSGSCHCGAVTFSVNVPEPTPFLRCYCSICRKTTGSGGYGVNLGARVEGLEVTGEQHLRHYHPASGATGTGPVAKSGRYFCGNCGSQLWNFDERWPDLLHPNAGAIDGDLPVPSAHTHMMLGSAANWVELHLAEGDKSFSDYPNESLADWHDRTGQNSQE